MSYEKIQNMLANAPHVAQWWKTNKTKCNRTFRRWENIARGCAIATFSFLMLGMGLDMSVETGAATPASMIHAAYLICCASGFAFWGILWWSFWSNKRPFKQQSDAFGFNLNNDRAVSEKNQQEVVTGLKEMGVDVNHIIALRGLDLPNGWWHTINFCIQRHTEEYPRSQLNEVYVELERTVLPPDHSKVLRL